MIYFDNKKNACAFIIENPLASIENDIWEQYAGTDKWDIIDGIFTDITNTEEYKEKKAKEERERLNALYMTRSDFFDGFILAFNLGQSELRAIVEQILNSINITDVEIKVALNNYDNALNFYRAHTLFTLLNNVEIPISDDITLVFTSDIWDKFFDTKDYKELQKAIKVKPEPEPIDTDSDSDTDTDDEDIEETENL